MSKIKFIHISNSPVDISRKNRDYLYRNGEFDFLGRDRHNHRLAVLAGNVRSEIFDRVRHVSGLQRESSQELGQISC